MILNGRPPSENLYQEEDFGKETLFSGIYSLSSKFMPQLFLRSQNEGRLNGIYIACSCPKIVHLMFAEDILLFGRVTNVDAQEMMDCLNIYQSWSDQELNISKSTIAID